MHKLATIKKQLKPLRSRLMMSLHSIKRWSTKSFRSKTIEKIEEKCAKCAQNVPSSFHMCGVYLSFNNWLLPVNLTSLPAKYPSCKLHTPQFVGKQPFILLFNWNTLSFRSLSINSTSDGEVFLKSIFALRIFFMQHHFLTWTS